MVYRSDNEYKLTKSIEYYLLGSIADFYYKYKDCFSDDEKKIIYLTVNVIYRNKNIPIYFIDKIFDINFDEDKYKWDLTYTEVKSFFRYGAYNELLLYLREYLENKLSMSNDDLDNYNLFYDIVSNYLNRGDNGINIPSFLLKEEKNLCFFAFLKENHEKNH